MRHTLDEWIAIYEEKTKDKFKVPPSFELYYLPERGIAQYAVDPKINALIIYQVCGDGKFWHDLGMIMCKQQGLTHVCTLCTRKIHPYIRLFGWKIVSEEELDGMKRYHCVDADGGKVTITHASYNEYTGEPNYYVTQEVKKVDV